MHPDLRRNWERQKRRGAHAQAEGLRCLRLRSRSTPHHGRQSAGAECLNADGTLCRPAIAAKVFASDEQRLWLNSLVHHHVADDIRCWLHDAASGKRRFVETAIPVTSGLTDICNDIWLVTCPDSVRVERIIGRDNCSPAQAQSRIDAQRHEFDSLPPETTELIENDPATPILLRIDSLLKK